MNRHDARSRSHGNACPCHFRTPFKAAEAKTPEVKSGGEGVHLRTMTVTAQSAGAVGRSRPRPAKTQEDRPAAGLSFAFA